MVLANYPRGVGGTLTNDVVGISNTHSSSVIIKRDKSDARNFSGGIETFVPARLLLELYHALLDDFLFWQDEATEPNTPSLSIQGEQVKMATTTMTTMTTTMTAKTTKV